jgi:hypothetical protein
MRIRAGSLAALVLLLATAPEVHAQASIDGAWKIAEVWGHTPDGEAWSFGESVQPSLFIFANGYCSFTAVNSAQPREIPEGASRADLAPEDGDGVWRSYLSNSGTYEVSGSDLLTRPSVALWPPFMAADSRPAYELEWDGADLLVTTRAGQAWRVWRLRRLD